MRVLVAPDDFKGTLTAREAAESIALGWRRAQPDAELDLAPLSDGGPGFVDIVAEAVGARIVNGEARGPLGGSVGIRIARVDSAAYVESAQACGLDLVGADQRDPLRATTYGVGEAIAHAVAGGATTVVVGLGGTSTTEGGAGALAALGARGFDADGHEMSLDRGGGGLEGLARLDLAAARARVRGVDLVIATDVRAPLLGPTGAAFGYAPQKGASATDAQRLEANLTHLSALVGPGAEAVDMRAMPGAGAAGGLGFGLLAIGGRATGGFHAVSDAIDLQARIARADLVITGEGTVDWQSLEGKVVGSVARLAAQAHRPLVVIAGRDRLDADAARAAGISEVVAVVGGVETDLRQPAAALASRTIEVASRWSSS